MKRPQTFVIGEGVRNMTVREMWSRLTLPTYQVGPVTGGNTVGFLTKRRALKVAHTLPNTLVLKPSVRDRMGLPLRDGDITKSCVYWPTEWTNHGNEIEGTSPSANPNSPFGI